VKKWLKMTVVTIAVIIFVAVVGVSVIMRPQGQELVYHPYDAETRQVTKTPDRGSPDWVNTQLSSSVVQRLECLRAEVVQLRGVRLRSRQPAGLCSAARESTM